MAVSPAVPNWPSPCAMPMAAWRRNSKSWRRGSRSASMPTRSSACSGFVAVISMTCRRWTTADRPRASPRSANRSRITRRTPSPRSGSRRPWRPRRRRRKVPTPSCWPSTSKRVATCSTAWRPRCAPGKPSRTTVSNWNPCCATCTPSRAVRGWPRWMPSAISPMPWRPSTKDWRADGSSPARTWATCCSAAMTACTSNSKPWPGARPRSRPPI